MHYELAALRKLLNPRPEYIGLLGSRDKATEHKRQLISEGFILGEVDAIRAPIGLDIVTETPEEITVSIVAELIARARCRGPPRRAF